MGGTSLAFRRWSVEPEFYRTVIRGTVLDIGAGHDALARLGASFPLAGPYTNLDQQPLPTLAAAEWIEGDATTGLAKLGKRQFDLVYSSHTLEHVWDPTAALRGWWDRVKPGGHLLVIVPSWIHYEREIWPPHVNTDHKTAWVMELMPGEARPFMRGLLDEARKLPGEIVRTTLADQGFRPDEVDDQTANGTCECSLELVMRKAK